jgi:hypothetical protein
MSCGAQPDRKQIKVQKSDAPRVIDMIDTCASIGGIKNTGSLSKEAIFLSDSLFHEILAFKKRLPEKIHKSQLLDYGPSKKIYLHCYFTIEKPEERDLLREINRFLGTELTSGWKGKHFASPDCVIAKGFAQSIRIYFKLDSVHVESPFSKFNQTFADYLRNKLMVYRSVAELEMDTGLQFNILRHRVMFANEDHEKDLLFIDVANEQIANALTDFWIYDRRCGEPVWIERLSRPVWDIDLQKRMFSTGWHSSGYREIERFKIVGTKAIVLGRRTY